jgi:DNA-binding response OmpR family regulator
VGRGVLAVVVTEPVRGGDARVEGAEDDAVMAAPPVALVIDPHERHGLAPMLHRGGFDIVGAPTAESALFELADHDVAAVVVALPLAGLGIGGLCQEVRRRGRAPILVTTEQDDVTWLAALAVGADDHLRVPCDERELAARLRALIRRASGRLSSSRVVVLGELELRLGRATIETQPSLALTQVQRTVLAQLTEQPGAVVTQGAILDRVRRVHGAVDDRQLTIEIELLQAAVAEAAGLDDALVAVGRDGWRLVDGR